jgi:exoribonuclease II
MVGTLARHNLEKEAPNGVATEMQDEGLTRRDLTALEFVTIDSASTEDMDDALYAEESADGKLHLTVPLPILPPGLLKAASWTKRRKSVRSPTTCRASTSRCCRANCQTISARCAQMKCARSLPAA